MSQPVQGSGPASASARQSLAGFLRRNRRRAVDDWEHIVRSIPAAALLDHDELRDHMPALLDRLLEVVEVPQASTSVEKTSGLHAIERLREGFNLEQLAWEYSALRSTLLRLNEEEGANLEPGAIVLLNDAIDQAVVRAVSRYHRARVRTLEALDRVAREGLLAEPQDLDALLQRLLVVIQDSVEPVDTAVLFLSETGRLVVRAAVGLERNLVGTFSLALGEGFAGTVARTKQSLFTHSAESDPLVRNPVLKMNGVKALYGVPLVHGDEVLGVVKMGSRTAADFAPEERLILRSTADRAAAFIAQKQTARDRELLLHVLAHELRSPLSSILVGAQTMQQQGPGWPDLARTVDRIVTSAERMDRLISDLTDFTQTRVTGTLPLQREMVDLGDLVEQIKCEVHERTGKELRIHRCGDTTGVWDGGRVLRVIANLVNNALAYGAPSEPVTVGVEGEDGCVILSVHNEGAPVPDSLRPRLFEPFKRGSQGVGSGLGLFIVRQIAYAHGGSVEVDSAAGRGTTFRVRLPRRAPD